MSSNRITKPSSRLHSSQDSGLSNREEAIRRALKKRRRRRFINLILFIGIITAIGLFIWAEQNRRSALSQLQAKESELEQFTGSGGGLSEEEADTVLEKVGELMVLPLEPKPSVATIINVSELRATSDFYNQAENGDFLIITDHRAILYDPEQNRIVDVVPLKKIEAGETPAPVEEVAPVPEVTPPPPPPEETTEETAPQAPPEIPLAQ